MYDHHQRTGSRCRIRRLFLEYLEERRVLDAAAEVVSAAPLASEEFPWHNDTYRLDVNGDGTTTTSDLLTVVNRILSEGSGELPVPPPAPVTHFYDTNRDNRLTASDLISIVNGLLLPPVVETSMLATFTIDVTPQVTVKATSPSSASLPDGTTVFLDIDLNNDGDFADDGELGHTQSTLYQGQSEFSVTPALARSTEIYTVRMRARVKNTDAVFGRSEALPLVVDTLTSDALADYVNAFDPTYSFSIEASQTRSIPFLGSYNYYAIDMTSQTWRSTADVNLPVWRHWLTMYVPTTPVSGTGVLLIDGGSNLRFDTGPPAALDLLGQAAITFGSVFVRLEVVPNEPVIFTDETESRTEDEIIAYSFDKFLNNIGQPGNDTWPVLVAMVKSAVRAMDTAQAILPTVKLGATLSDFVVTGYSKRGWTTWLTAAVDDRVRAIIPGVFDNLNQGPQMVHHYGAYGFFSQAVQPYNEMQIFDRILTPEALHLSRITDPYRYLSNGRFDDMPKLIINSTGDEFFNPDSAQFYFDDLPGEQNYLLYIPNTGHGLDIDLDNPNPQDSQVLSSTVTFVDALLNNRTLPQYSWTVAQDGAIRVETDTTPLEVNLWHADNTAARDFRRTFHPDIQWTSESLTASEAGVYVGNVDAPASGARAYFIQLVFPNTVVTPVPLLSDPYVFTTEVRVKSTLPLFEWPFESAFDVEPLVDPAGAIVENLATLPTSSGAGELNAAASALAIEQQSAIVAEQPIEDVLPLLAKPVEVAPVLARPASPLQVAESPEWDLVEDVSDELFASLLSDDTLLDLLA